MATAPTNKLPTFGARAQIDASIIDDTSNLKLTGFQPNTIIDSAQINTYVRTLIQAERGLVEFFYEEGTGQANITANSPAGMWFTYIKKGFDKKIETVKYAESLKNERTITLQGQANGSVTFDGSKDVAINVEVSSANALMSKNVGNETRPVYFNESGLPVQTTMCKNLGQLEASSSPSNGEYLYKPLSDNRSFLAFVELSFVDDSGVTIPLSSGIMRFNNGVPVSVLNDTSYRYSDTGDVLARVSQIYGTTQMVGVVEEKRIGVSVRQIATAGGYSRPNASFRPTLTIYKLYEIG